MTQSNHLQPFERAGRAEAREISVGIGPQTMFIPADSLTMRPGANWRCPSPYQTQEEFEEELHIPELAANIFSNSGPAEPIIGDLEKGTGKFFISEGQRRMLAIRHLLAQGLELYPNGKAIAKVEVRLNPPEFTDEDRLKLNYTTQNKLKLKPSQLAFGFLQVKQTVLVDGKPITNEQIATNYGVSRQMIDNYIKIAELPAETLKKLDYGEISQADALKPLRKHREIQTTAPTINPALHEFMPGGFIGMPTKQLQEGDKIPPPPKLYNEKGEEVDGWTDEKPKLFVPSNELDQETIEHMGWADENGVVTIPTSENWTAAQVQILDEMGYDVPALYKKHEGVKIDKSSHVAIEEQSHITSRKVREPENTERREAEEAMRGLDYRPDKEAAEMSLNEIMKLMDKLNVQASHLPNTMKQAKDDMSGLIVFIQSKLTEVIDLVKKAPEKHY